MGRRLSSLLNQQHNQDQLSNMERFDKYPSKHKTTGTNLLKGNQKTILLSYLEKIRLHFLLQTMNGLLFL